jgi:SWI/SNF-related matrix-associated actin-dependent regulator 1 of chromatin subfamily A
MLQIARGGEFRYPTTGKKWLIEGIDLRDNGLKAPQGFTFELSYSSGISNFFWTSNEFAAYLFYKRYGKTASEEVRNEFLPRLKHEKYLYSLSYSTESDIELRVPDGMAYRPYQKAGIEYCLRTDNTLIADQQRLGKTIIALGLINNLKNVNKVLVVCPKTAKPIWLEESKLWLIDKRKTQVLSAGDTIDPDAELIITNYDNLHIQTKLTRMEFDVVIGDEVHLASRERARRTKFFQAINGRKKLGLSGTPLLNNPIDLLTVLQWIDPLWRDFYIFREKFATKSGITLTLDEAQELARSTCMLRRIQAQVFANEATERRIVPLTPPEEVKDLIDKKLDFSEYATTSRKLGISKVPLALDYLDAYTSEGEKIVAFCWHREVIRRLQASLGNKAVAIFGESNDEERTQAVERFRNDPTCSVMLGSISAAGMALNLSVSNHIVFVEQDWSNGMMEQAEERCSDKEQKQQVTIEYLTYPNTLDFKKLQKICFKDDRADKAIDLIY